jgi:hypothetical protein
MVSTTVVVARERRHFPRTLSDLFASSRYVFVQALIVLLKGEADVASANNFRLAAAVVGESAGPNAALRFGRADGLVAAA